MKKAAFVLGIVLLFAALIFYRYMENLKQDNAVPVREAVDVSAVTVEKHRFTDKVEYVANLEPVEMAAVVPKVVGKTVLEVMVREGDSVKKGDILAKADYTLIMQDIARAREAVNIAATNYRTAEKDFRRMKELYSQDVISRQAYEHSEAQYESSVSRLKEARSSLAQLETMLSYHKITAPVDGVISKRFIDPGDTMSQQPAFLINKQDILEASGNVPAREFIKLETGQEASVTVDAASEKKFTGRVSRLSPMIDPATRTGEVIVDLSSEGILKPGMFARVEIVTGSHEALALPRDVVRRVSGTGNFRVYLLSGDVAEERIVSVGSREKNLVEIEVGLKMGDLVISTLSDKVRDGASVEVKR
jgi:RND family efflux transporter MFP subunit